MTDTLDDLIRRLIDAKEGSRELDQDIEIAVNPEREEAHPSGSWSRGRYSRSSVVYRCPRCSTSIDAALSLLPAGYDYLLGSANGPWARIWEKNTGAFEHYAEAATPALALAAVALRARQSLGEPK